MTQTETWSSPNFDIWSPCGSGSVCVDLFYENWWAVSYIPWLRELWVLPVACLSVCMAMACMRVIWTHVHMCIIVAAPLIFPPMPRWPQPELTESLSLPETILQHTRSLVNTQPDDHIHWPLTVFNKVTLGTQQTISVRRINYQHVFDRRGPD